MAYTPPSTVTGSDVLTAALWNTQIRDNLNELRNPLFCKVGLNFAISPYSATAIPWEVALHNVGGMWSAGQPTRVTIPQTGLYYISFSAQFTTGAGANARSVIINKTSSGVQSVISQDYAPGIPSGTSPGVVVAGTTAGPCTTSRIVRLVQNDFLTCDISVSGINTSGASLGPLVINAGGSGSEGSRTTLSVLWIGAIA